MSERTSTATKPVTEVSREMIKYALSQAVLAEVVLYEVPETACLQMADLTEAQRDMFDHLAVWAAAELDSKDEDRFWDVIAQEARSAGCFNDFVQAVRYAVIEENEPGKTGIVFRGFTWDDSGSEEAPPSEHAPAVFEPGV